MTTFNGGKFHIYFDNKMAMQVLRRIKILLISAQQWRCVLRRKGTNQVRIIFFNVALHAAEQSTASVQYRGVVTATECVTNWKAVVSQLLLVPSPVAWRATERERRLDSRSATFD